MIRTSTRTLRPGSCEHGWSALGWAALAFLLALPVLWLRARFTKEWADEGYFANGALRVLEGEVIYRDFQHNYPPGRCWMLALLMRLFGRELWVVRGTWILFHASAAALALLVARRIVSAPVALLVALTVALNVAFMNKSVELFLGSMILLVIFRALEGRSRDIACGAWLALAGHLRHDAAVFGALIWVLAILLAAALDPERETSLGRALASRLMRARGFLLGAALALLPSTLYLAAHGALRSAAGDLVFSGFIANRLLAKPFPVPTWSWSLPGLWSALTGSAALYAIPPLSYALGLAVGGARLVRGERVRSGALVLCASLFGALLYLQVLPRSDVGHLTKAYLPAHVVGLFLVEAAWRALVRSLRERRRARSALALCGAILVTAMPVVNTVRLGFLHRRSAPYLFSHADAYATIRTPHGSLVFRREKAAGIRRVFRAIEPFAGAGGEWMVVFPAGALVNLLFALPSPLSYDLLRPGELAGRHGGEWVPNAPEVLAGIERRLEETRPRFLLDSGEDTNPAVTELFRRFAKEHGYRSIPGAYFTLHVRR